MKRHRIIQSGKVIEDGSHPNNKLFINMAWEYEGKRYRLMDMWEDGVIRSEFYHFPEAFAGKDVRTFKFKDLIKPFNAKVPYPVYNTCSAKDCPALESGECLVGEKDCYAWRDENMYKTPLIYRRRQEQFWRNKSSKELATLLLDNIGDAKALRFNESGDFRTLDDVKKMDEIAMYIGYYGVKAYVFTARRSLGVQQMKHITIIGSSIAGLDGQFIMSHNAKEDAKRTRMAGIRAIVCPADCSICSVCPNQKAKPTIVFGQKH